MAPSFLGLEWIASGEYYPEIRGTSSQQKTLPEIMEGGSFMNQGVAQQLPVNVPLVEF